MCVCVCVCECVCYYILRLKVFLDRKIKEIFYE